eukprot:g5158.t1
MHSLCSRKRRGNYPRDLKTDVRLESTAKGDRLSCRRPSWKTAEVVLGSQPTISVKKLATMYARNVPHLLSGLCQSSQKLKQQNITEDVNNDCSDSNDFQAKCLDTSQSKTPVCFTLKTCSKNTNISPTILLDGSLTREATFEELMPSMSSVVMPASSRKGFYWKGMMPITRMDLLRISQKVLSDFTSADLQTGSKNYKTSWKCIQELHLLIGNAVPLLENIINEVGDELRHSESGTNHTQLVQYQQECNDRNNTNKALFDTFEKLSSIASQYCTQVMILAANHLDEYEDITECAAVLVLSISLNLMKMYIRINKVEESFIIKKKGAICVISWYFIQEKNRAESVSMLMKAVNSYTVRIQDTFLQLGFGNYKKGVSRENRTNLDIDCQHSWTWLKELSRKAVVLCASKRRDVLICLIDTCIEVTERFSDTTQVLCIQDRIRGKTELTEEQTFSRQNTILHFLIPLLDNVEEIKSDLEKSGLISVEELPQISEASTKFGNLSNLLKTTFQKASDSAHGHSFFSSAIRSDCGTLAVKLVKNFFKILMICLFEGSSGTTSTKKLLSDLCTEIDNLGTKFQLPINLNERQSSVTNYPFSILSGASNTNFTSSVNSTCMDTRTTNFRAQFILRIEGKAPKTTKSSPFSRQGSRPPEHDNAYGSCANGRLPYCDANTSEYVGLVCRGYDPSLDRKQESSSSNNHHEAVDVNVTNKENHSNAFSCETAPSTSNDESGRRPVHNGCLSTVYQVTVGNTCIAVKESKCEDPNLASRRLLKEATIHEKLNCNRNIVRFLGKCTETDEFGVIHTKGIKTEWCRFGDLKTIIQKAKCIEQLDREGNSISKFNHQVSYAVYKDWIKRLDIIADVAAGASYMHCCNVVHRDLSSGNILLDSVGRGGEFRAKICDFKRAYYLKDGQPIQRLSSYVNSVPWMGPEVLRKEKYGLKADVYSIGTLLWQLMYLEDPWNCLKEIAGNDEAFIQLRLTDGTLQLPISEDDAPENIPEFPRLVELVKSAWQTNPDDRPSMAEFYCVLGSIHNSIKSRTQFSF